MDKSTIKYLGSQGHSDVTVYKFNNTQEDQKLAKDVLNQGKAPIGPRPDVPGISYVLPTNIPLNTYPAGEGKIFRKDTYHE